jgi:hypothetical protein
MRIVFGTSNAAFEGESLPYELKDIFDSIVIGIEGGRRSGVVVDSNGNTVGNWDADK